jgi:hypothetical protein
MKKTILIILLLGICAASRAQNNDSLILARLNRIDHIVNILREFRIQIYAQPQWQKADTVGVTSFGGGNFPTAANNRFMLRRGRFKLSWQHEMATKFGDTAKVGEFVFQYDASEKGFTALKDFYGRLIDPWTGWFGIQGGIFLRPFGYESPASPATHESPEFARMNQTIMPNECELGEVFIVEAPRTFKPLYIRLDASLVNGEGIGVGSQTGTYQSRKDFIGRLILGKSITVDRAKFGINASGSYYNGGVLQNSNNVYEVETVSGTTEFVNVTKGTADTAQKFKTTYKREYFGGHLQFNFDYQVNEKFSTTTMLRGEIIAGQQPGTLASSQVPLGPGNSVPVAGNDLYIRKFIGEIAYFTQSFHNKVGKQTFHQELTVKLDIYDPNTQIAGSSILAKNGFSGTDVKFTTLGFGYTLSPSPYFKLMIWYDHVMNESTGLTNYQYVTNYPKNDILTIRTQFMIDTWWFDKKKTHNDNLISKSY